MNKKNASNCNFDNKETQFKMNKNVKKRNWSFIAYPESLPENWIETLIATGLPIAISPLHDKDINADDTEKKAHYHIVLCYNGPTTYEVVNRLAQSLNSSHPKQVESVKGYIRYFTHKDNAEKYQYEDKDIIYLNGFDTLDYLELTKNEVSKIKFSLTLLIRKEDIIEYSTFIDYVQDNCSFDEYITASSNSIFFNAYISSRRHKQIINS